MTNVPDGMEIAIFARVVSGVWSVCSGSYPAFTAPRRLYRRLYAKSDLSGSVLRCTGHAEAVRIVYDPSVISYERCYRYFGRITIPPRECVRAMPRHAVSFSDLSADPRTGCRSRASLERFQAAMLAADDDRHTPRKSLTPHRFIMPKMTTSNSA